MIDNWKDTLDNNESLAAIFVDLRKAFDTIDRGLLLEKLKLYGFNDKSHDLIENLLTDRKYKVKLNGNESVIKNSDIGVPEGSITGPLLFIIFINDICYLKTESKMILFADDTTIFHKSKNITDLKNVLIKDMLLFSEWLANNKLLVNWSKTHAIHFKPKHSRNFTVINALTVNKNSIEFVKKTKLLGVMIDDCLSFEDHTRYICGKVTSKVATLSRNISIFSTRYRYNIIKMFIVPHFEYCSILFYNNYGKNFEKLEKKYNWSFNKIVNIKSRNYESLTKFYDFLSKHNLLPLQIRLFNHFCFFLFKLVKLYFLA